MTSISFANAYLLLIAIPLLALLVAPFLITVNKENRNGHNIASMVLHVLMALLIAFAAAGTEVVAVMTETNVYVVADVSYSARKNLDAIDGYIDYISDNLPRNSKLGVICFGKDYKVTTKLGKKLSSVKESGVDDTESNIEDALNYAGSLFDNDVIKRIVVITDGRQTYSNDAADLTRTVSNLQARNIKVDAIYLNDNIDESAKEVQISGAEYTGNVFINHAETVGLTVESSYVTNAIVTLYKDGEQYDRSSLSLSLGTNTVTFDLDTSQEGTFGYTAEVSVDEDECSFNNSYSFTQTVTGVVNVLAVTSSNSENDEIASHYDETANITFFNVTENKSVPVSLEELCKYDEIVLSDVDLTAIDNYSMFLDSLDVAVSLFGKSLVTFGNLSIQSKTEGELKRLDDMLPVRYGDVTDNPKLYTLVMDVSHSMNLWSRMIIAKQAAAQLVNFLSDDDYVCLIWFSGDVGVALPPTSLSNRQEVLNSINNLTASQGTITSLGLKMAMDTIRNLNFSEKQVMLITDGNPYSGTLEYDGIVYEGGASTDREYASAFVETMRAYGIYTSVLQVGGGNEDNRDWMRNLASLGGGKYYLAENEDALGGVLFDDIAEDMSKAEIEQESDISKNKPRDSVLEGVNLDNAYVMRYMLSDAKSSATNVLTVGYRVNKVTIDVPLYAYWSYGNGTVASYTGFISQIRQSGAVSPSNKAFFDNVINTTMPLERTASPYILSAGLEGKLARIEISPAQLHSSASATISVTAPSGEVIDGSFVFDSSNYYYEFRAPENGRYDVEVTYSYGGNDYSEKTSVILSYAPEYDAFAAYEASVLYKMLDGKGTVSEDGKLTITNDESEVLSYTFKLTVPFMVAAVVLFVVDIAVRKLKWNDIVSLFGRVGKRGKK